LTARDLTFGIAAIVGAGIFSTIGKASADGGPCYFLLFLFTAIACSFAALLMLNLPRWFLFLEVLIRIRMLLWRNYSLDYRLALIMEYSVGNTLLLYRGVIILQDCSKVVV
jgi:hypothetical protein